MTVVRRPPYGSRIIRTPAGPAVLTRAPLGAEEIEFALPHVRFGRTRRDLDATLALADRCRAPAHTVERTKRP